MTVIVGFVGADGAVMASDSEGTEGAQIRRDVKKCWTCGGLLMGLSGAASVKQPLEAAFARAVETTFGEAAEVNRWEARELLRQQAQDVLAREYSSFVSTRPGHGAEVIGSCLLVIGRDADGYWLLEIDPNNSPTFYTDHGGFHTIGTGSAAAYFATGLMKEYEPQGRSFNHLKLVAYRTVKTCIEVLGGRLGVGGHVQLHASRDGGPFERETAEGLAVLSEAVEKWTTLEAESLDQVVLSEVLPAADQAAADTPLPEAIEEDESQSA